MPVNLHSDTQTKPTAAMRAAIAAAEVGDEQRGQDPTTSELERRVAELLGHEAAVFLPSGTMCNEIAVRLHIRPGGDEVILDRSGAPDRRRGRRPGGARGRDDLRARRRGRHLHGRAAAAPRCTSTATATRRARGSSRWSRRATWAAGGSGRSPRIEEVLGVARGHGLRAHLDGARLMNAVVASGVPAADYARGFDTAWIDFSKGLGAPVGAVLAASRELIDEAWRYKQMMGGALRQSGILSAGCLYALDHHVERLAEDHANARALAEGLAAHPGRRDRPRRGGDEHRDLRGTGRARFRAGARTGRSTCWRSGRGRCAR